MATQINAGDSAATARGKIVDVLALGLINPSGITSWGAARAKLNELAVLFGRDQIGDKELAASVREKIEAMILGPAWVNGARLVLDFANNRAWRDGLISLASTLTISRASGGSYFDAQGVLRMAANDALRFDHDPDTKAALGALIEPQRANLLLQSENIGDVGWAKTRSMVTDAGTDRGMKLWRFVPDATEVTSHIVARNATFAALAADTVFSVQIVAKADGPGAKRLALRFADTVGFRTYVYVDLTTGVITSGASNATITPRTVVVALGGGYFRIEVSYIVRATSTYATIQVYASAPTADAVTTYNFNGTDGYLLALPQIEQAGGPTSYIPTTTATATRAADVLKVPTGAWWNAGTGTLRMDGVVTTPILASGALDVSAMALAAGKSRVKTVEFGPS